jgi:hypothetical protein
MSHVTDLNLGDAVGDSRRPMLIGVILLATRARQISNRIQLLGSDHILPDRLP